jgi:glycosyltransferase involved in cell wall biosynthesis
MKIAVNTRFLLPGQMEGYGYFFYETLRRITISHPEHDFIFIFDRPFDKKFIFSPNITSVVAGPPARHPLLWKFWYDVKLPAILKKYKADLFFSAEGFCSLRTNVPQSIVVHDLAFIHYPSHLKRSQLLFYKRYTPKFLAKARSIATVSEFSRKDIINQYHVPEKKISIVYSAAKDIFKPVSEEVKISTREKFTDNKEFFLYVGAIHPRKNLTNLLKAFSIFKKRQQTNIKLVLAGRLAWKYNSFMESLKSYKYRDDIVMPGYLNEEELVNLTGSAYALVYPSLFEGFGVPVLEAMQCQVPVITSSNSSMEEIAEDAALFADPKSIEDLAEKMMRIYKDEDLRARLVNRGKEIAVKYSWEKTAELLWQSMMRAVK